MNFRIKIQIMNYYSGKDKYNSALELKLTFLLIYGPPLTIAPTTTDAIDISLYRIKKCFFISKMQMIWFYKYFLNFSIKIWTRVPGADSDGVLPLFDFSSFVAFWIAYFKYGKSISKISSRFF